MLSNINTNVEKLIEQYVIEHNMPNAKIIDNKDENIFEYYTIESIPKGMRLADSVIFDENRNVKYGYVKDFDGEEMRLIIGYTGAGKSTRHLLQNIAAAAKSGQSMIVTDTSGQLLDYSYDLLRNLGVNIKVINFGDTSKSDHYNPFYSIACKVKKEKKITKEAEAMSAEIAKLIINNLGDDPCWELGARSFLQGIMLGMFDALAKGNIEPEDITIYNLVQQYHWLRRESIDGKIKGIEYYKDLDEDSLCIQCIATVIECADTTRASYLGIVNDYISVVNNREVFEITSSNNIDLKELWKKQTVIFINTADKSAGDIVSSLLVNQLYDDAFEESQKTPLKRLPIAIQLFLDEFANISFGDKHQFTKMLTTSRKMGMFFNMYIQAYSQLTSKFGESVTNTILSNCTQYFLGTRDYKSREMFASSCGQKTIESFESYITKSIPKLVTVNVLSAEVLGKLKRGEFFVLRQGYDVCKSFIVPSYECSYFNTNDTYNDKFEAIKYDYESNVILPPLMTKKLDPKKCTVTYISNNLCRDDIIKYIDVFKHCDKLSTFEKRRFIHLGIIKEKDGKLYPVVDVELFEKAREKTRIKSLWD